MASDRMDRFERNLAEVGVILREMAARQQYHDEAFERFDVESKEFNARMARLEAVVANDTENIQSLLRIAEMHDRRLNSLEGSDGQ
jgi:hypothetical protein